MSRVEPTLSLSLPLRPLLLLLLLAERAVSTHTECFIEIYDYPALCGYERSAVCVYARAYTRTHTHMESRGRAARAVPVPACEHICAPHVPRTFLCFSASTYYTRE